mmetsp:Transcript_74681/g.175282  ORF Transcript_74681/g.175282 Transcript_74681/m.175282 type:complete len:361 (-) Transcript_74681:148-1230(-)
MMVGVGVSAPRLGLWLCSASTCCFHSLACARDSRRSVTASSSLRSSALFSFSAEVSCGRNASKERSCALSRRTASNSSTRASVCCSLTEVSRASCSPPRKSDSFSFFSRWIWSRSAAVSVVWRRCWVSSCERSSSAAARAASNWESLSCMPTLRSREALREACRSPRMDKFSERATPSFSLSSAASARAAAVSSFPRLASSSSCATPFSTLPMAPVASPASDSPQPCRTDSDANRRASECRVASADSSFCVAALFSALASSASLFAPSASAAHCTRSLSRASTCSLRSCSRRVAVSLSSSIASRCRITPSRSFCASFSCSLSLVNSASVRFSRSCAASRAACATRFPSLAAAASVTAASR